MAVVTPWGVMPRDAWHARVRLWEATVELEHASDAVRLLSEAGAEIRIPEMDRLAAAQAEWDDARGRAA